MPPDHLPPLHPPTPFTLPRSSSWAPPSCRPWWPATFPPSRWCPRSCFHPTCPCSPSPCPGPTCSPSASSPDRLRSGCELQPQARAFPSLTAPPPNCINNTAVMYKAERSQGGTQQQARHLGRRLPAAMLLLPLPRWRQAPHFYEALWQRPHLVFYLRLRPVHHCKQRAGRCANSFGPAAAAGMHSTRRTSPHAPIAPLVSCGVSSSSWQSGWR